MGINDGVSIRKLVARQVMIADNYLHPQRFRPGNLFHRLDSAINCDDQVYPLRCQLFDCINIQPVAFVEAIRDIYPRGVTKLVKKFIKQRARCDPISVIIAINCDIFAT